MNSKKNYYVVGLSFFIMTIILLNLVSAQYFGDARRGAETLINLVVDAIEPFLIVILGGGDYSGYLLFEKFLFFLLLLSIINMLLRRTPVFIDNYRIAGLVSVIVSIFAVRFLDFAWINTIILEYQVLGIAMLGILPFLIYLLFLHTIAKNAVVRKIGWIFFIVIYLFLWGTSSSMMYGDVYFWTMIVALVFLFFDGTIHRYLEKQRWAEARDSGVIDHVSEIDEQLWRLERANLPPDVRRRQRRRLMRQREKLLKLMS